MGFLFWSSFTQHGRPVSCVEGKANIAQLEEESQELEIAAGMTHSAYRSKPLYFSI